MGNQETIEQRSKKLRGLQVTIGATAGVPEAIDLARSKFVEAYGRSPLHDDLAYACLLIYAYCNGQVVPWVRVIDEAMVLAHIGTADSADDYATAKDKLNRLICWEIDVARYNDAALQAQVPELLRKLRISAKRDGELGRDSGRTEAIEQQLRELLQAKNAANAGSTSASSS